MGALGRYLESTVGCLCDTFQIRMKVFVLGTDVFLSVPWVTAGREKAQHVVPKMK